MCVCVRTHVPLRNDGSSEDDWQDDIPINCDQISFAFAYKKASRKKNVIHSSILEKMSVSRHIYVTCAQAGWQNIIWLQKRCPHKHYHLYFYIQTISVIIFMLHVYISMLIYKKRHFYNIKLCTKHPVQLNIPSIQTLLNKSLAYTTWNILNKNENVNTIRLMKVSMFSIYNWHWTFKMKVLGQKYIKKLPVMFTGNYKPIYYRVIH